MPTGPAAGTLAAFVPLAPPPPLARCLVLARVAALEALHKDPGHLSCGPLRRDPGGTVAAAPAPDGAEGDEAMKAWSMGGLIGKLLESSETEKETQMET